MTIFDSGSNDDACNVGFCGNQVEFMRAAKTYEVDFEVCVGHHLRTVQSELSKKLHGFHKSHG